MTYLYSMITSLSFLIQHFYILFMLEVFNLLEGFKNDFIIISMTLYLNFLVFEQSASLLNLSLICNLSKQLNFNSLSSLLKEASILLTYLVKEADFFFLRNETSLLSLSFIS